ncbi:MAG: type II CAAX endopeptidase family protein [Candidatus Zixiibacteriota bacterium]
MAVDFDRGGSSADHLEDAPLTPPESTPESQPRLTLISYLVLGLLAIIWPFSSFVFLDSQLELASEVVDPILEIYLPTILIQLLIMAAIVIAIRSEQARPGDIGVKNFSRWSFPQAIAFLLLANIVLSSVQITIAAQSPDAFTEFGSLLPKTMAEKSIWVVLCAIIAICEEVTFRGYILTRVTQIARGRIWIGVLVSTLAFASGHLYQGLGGFVLIFVYGLMFCGLCLYTGSLYPAIIAHFLQDAGVLFLPDTFK